MENHEHNMIIGKQYEPFVIPCKPTSPQVTVELFREDGEVNILSFDHMTGFVVVDNETVEYGSLRCEFTLSDKSAEKHLLFVIDRRFTFRSFSII